MSHDVHLVGSVPLADARQVFATVSAALGPHLKRIPDGETGERSDWITWLEPVFAGNSALEKSDELFRVHASGTARLRYRLKPGKTVDDVSFDNLFYSLASTNLKGFGDSLSSPLLAREAIMAAKEISVKKYVVRLSREERERLETLIRKGKSPAQRLLKARILLKADVSEAGEGWSDSRIIKALETSVSMVYRVRKQLVEEGFEAVLSRKQRATPAVARIFDGEKEAKLIALACSKPPKGRARWTLRLLETKVVELDIVDRASDSTIGRALKKTFSSRIGDSNGLSRRRPTALS